MGLFGRMLNRDLLLYFILLFQFTILGCGNSTKTQDPNTGEVVSKTCENTLQFSNNNRGELKLAGDHGYVDIPAYIPSDTKKIIRLYNETTCSSRLDTDFFGTSDSYFAVGDSFMATEVVHGRNVIYFVVDQCADVDIKNNYKCIDKIDSDSGYFYLYVP